MMERTDRHCRFFLRLITRHALLYTEMVSTSALIHGNRDQLLRLNSPEHPVALQLGGSDPFALARCAEYGARWGYDEINLNVGCPSDRVISARFGACLMKEPEHVARCVAAMQNAVDLPVTVKCRIGIDEQEDYSNLRYFVERIAERGCRTFIIHARKAWLKGLSPKQNRETPPLRYDMVYRLKSDLPGLEIVINGGIQNLNQAEDHLAHVDGVMLGRAAYQRPYALADLDARIYGDYAHAPTRAEVIDQMLPYVEQEVASGVRLANISRHLLGLYHGRPGGRQFRRYLAENAHRPDADSQVIAVASQIAEKAALRGVIHARLGK